jgi:sulfotransferase family protein
VSEPPLLVLGVRRSGTTLLRVMLDRHSRLAVPDESYFLPQLAARHGERPDVEAFVDDLRRLPTLVEWDVDPAAVRARLRPGDSLGRAIAAVYEVYAERHGKDRWGDKTPMYMGYLPLLERLFPDARYVHLIRDGRDAASSFLELPEGIVTRSWAHPRDAAGFAAQWRSEVLAAHALGRRVGDGRYFEVRYEELVREPRATLVAICAFAGLAFEDGMLEYAGEVDVSRKPHQQSLAKPPTPGLRDWRSRMSPEDVAAFESVAGDLLARLGYEVRSGVKTSGRLTRLSYAARSGAWRLAGRALQRSPLWRRRHPPLR